MQNTLPVSYPQLLVLGGKVVAGLNKHQDALGVTRHRDVAVLGSITALTTAADNFRLARLGKSAAFAAQAKAFALGGVFIGQAVDVLIPHLGRNWGAPWREAGFPDSLAVPSSLAERLETLRSLEVYFKKHPTHGNEEKQVTRAFADQFHGALSAAINGVTACKSDTKGKLQAREAAKKALRKRLRGVINELNDLIAEDDARWAALGFNLPGDSETPEAVEDLDVEPGGPGLLRVDFEGSARAQRYQIEVLVVGTDQEFRRVATVQDSRAEVAGLPPGATVKVRVVAANDAGESVPSEVAEAVAQAA